jgi:flavin reductase (DIM6/NTAB) family NADH-FMN oxidoreductase RutF
MNTTMIDTRELRNALGCFATGITVITALDESKAPVGLTANSFTSLSLDPPLVLFCVDRTIKSFQAIHANRHFAVNILREDQENISRQFAKSGADKWSGIKFETWDTGCPILGGCIANLECDVEQVFEGGDHIIVVGKVRRMVFDQDAECRPLLYFKGKYGAVARS